MKEEEANDSDKNELKALEEEDSSIEEDAASSLSRNLNVFCTSHKGNQLGDGLLSAKALSKSVVKSSRQTMATNHKNHALALLEE